MSINRLSVLVIILLFVTLSTMAQFTEPKPKAKPITHLKEEKSPPKGEIIKKIDNQ